MGVSFTKVTPKRVLAGFISGSILGAYFYDKYESHKLHKRAIQLAKEIGDHPVHPSHLLTQSKNLIFFWTTKNSFSGHLLGNNFRKYAGLYLTLAGIDYDLYEVVLSKATFSSRIPGSTTPTFDQFVKEFYQNREKYLERMEEMTEPKEYISYWNESVKTDKLLYSLNGKDSVLRGNLFDGIIACNESDSFLRRIGDSFLKRKKIESIIKSTFELIELHRIKGSC